MVPFTIFYFLFCLCFMVPPSAFVSIGLTVPSLCGSWLGSEDFLFIHYHIKRTCATVLVHSLLPLSYFVGVFLVEGSKALASLLSSQIGWLMFQAAVLLPLAAGTLVWYWYMDGWRNHPVVRELRTYSNNLTWMGVAAEINSEFRGIDKVCVSTNPLVKTVITSTWIIQVLPYKLHIAKQSHVSLVLEKQEEHQLSATNPGGAQYLAVRVQFSQRVNRNKSFTIRLNAFDYNAVQDRLQRPIQNIRGLVIHSNLESRFVEVFVEKVRENPIVHTAEELEPCIGCMTTPANVRLVRRCELTREGVSCSPCFCRPMWCVQCLSKWFVARQDREHPEEWLSSRSPCPTCRSLFCLVDVSLVEQVPN